MSAAKKKRELNRATTEHGVAKLSAQFATSNHTMLNIAESVAAKRIEELEQQLANREKQNVMLRNALKKAVQELDSCQKVIWLARDYGFDPAYVEGARKAIIKSVEALDATQDLKDCILCDAEPVGFFEVNDFGNWEQDTRNVGTPLYKARKP